MPKRKRSSDSDCDSTAAVEPKRPKNEIVSFTKRRQGLFLKAAELCTLFDSQIAVLVLSPSGNPFAFGHSSVDDVLRRYDNRTITAETMRVDFISEAQRLQASEIEGLKVRVRARKKKEQLADRGEFLAINDGDIDSRLTVEELNGLKLECLNLLSKIRKKLRNDSSSDFEVKEEIPNSSYVLNAQRNDMSFSSGKSVINCEEGFESAVAVDSSQKNDVSFPSGVGLERRNDESFLSCGTSNFTTPEDLDLLLDFDFDSTDDFSLEAMLMDQGNDMSSMAEFGVTDPGTCPFVEENDLNLNGLIEHDMSSMAEFGTTDPWNCPFIEENDLVGLSYEGINGNDMSFSMAGIEFDYMTTPTISLPG